MYRRRGFTLIELLVVIVVIGVLATIGLATFDGAIESARYGKARAVEAQIVRKMLASVESYVSFWTFSSEGNSVRDTSGFDYTVTLPAYVSKSNDVPQSSGDDYSLEFSGQGGIVLAGNRVLPENQITVSMWLKVDRHKNWNNYYRYIDSRVVMFSNASGRLCFQVHFGSAACSDDSLDLDKWYQAVGVYDGEHLYLYLNGNLVKKQFRGVVDVNPNDIGSQLLGQGQPGQGGSGTPGPSSERLEGHVDDVRVWGDAFFWNDNDDVN